MRPILIQNRDVKVLSQAQGATSECNQSERPLTQFHEWGGARGVAGGAGAKSGHPRRNSSAENYHKGDSGVFETTERGG